MYDWYADEAHSLFGLTKKLQQDAVPPPRVQGRWNVTTLRAILTNPVYAGQVYAGRIQAAPYRVRPPEEWIAVAQVPAIVTQEQFDRVQTKIAQNRQFARRNNTRNPYLLRALVSCGVCRLACVGQTRRRYAYYTCAGRSHPVLSSREERCRARLFRPRR